MSKIICEICGTLYPDNATQCPICGYPRKAGDYPKKHETEAAGGVSSDRVRGGKFSNSNVKKRNYASGREYGSGSRRPVRQAGRKEPKRDSKTDKGLLITVWVLLAAVIFVGAYIAIRFVNGASAYDTQFYATAPSTQDTQPEQPVDTEPEDTGAACTDFEIVGIDLEQGLVFMGQGRSWRMNVTAVPENTTDTLTVTSSDESVVSVNSGFDWVELVSAAPGTATITVRCGSVTKQFPAGCDFDGDTAETDAAGQTDTDQTEAATAETRDSNWKLNYTDASIAVGYSFDLKLTNDAGEVASVNWISSSDDISINGNTATGKALNSYIEVSCTLDGKTYMCIVRVVNF